MKQNGCSSYPLLRNFLALKEIALKPTFTVQDVATMFNVPTLSIQSWISTGTLKQRKVPGKAKV